jgi:hypothetical protein
MSVVSVREQGSLMRSHKRRTAVLAVVPVTAAIALTACGGDSKPGYCADRTTLEQSVKDVGDVNVRESGGVQQLKTQLQKVETDARTLVSSAKSDFPSETEAIDSSVAALKTAVQAVPSSPSAPEVATVAASAKSVVTSFQTFKEASNSNCE